MQKYSNIFEQEACLTEQEKWDYIHGNVSDKELHRVEKHMLECEMCSDEIEGLKLLGAEKSEEIVYEINKRILDKVSTQKRVKPIVVKRFLATAAALFLLFGIGTVIKNLIDDSAVNMEIAQQEYQESEDIKDNKTEYKSPVKESDIDISDKSEEEKEPDFVEEKKIVVNDEVAKEFEQEKISEQNIRVDNEIENVSNGVAYKADIEQVPAESQVPAMQNAPVIKEDVEEEAVEELELYEEIIPDQYNERNMKSEEKASGKSKRAYRVEAAPAEALSSVDEMSADQSISNELHTAYSLFNAKKYKELYVLYENMKKDHSDYREIQWLAAQSYFETGKTDQCKILLEEILETDNDFVKDAKQLLDKIKKD